MALRLSNHTQLKFPKINGELMRWKNILSAKRDNIVFSFGNENDTYISSIYSYCSSLDSYSLGVLVEINGVPASVWLTSWPLTDRLKGYLGGKELHQIPADLRAELLESALKPLLSIITLHTNTQIRILNFLNLKPSEVNVYSLGLTLRHNNNTQDVKMIVLMHNKLFPVMRKILAYWPDQNNTFWHQQKTLLWLQAGSLVLSMKELNHLDTSDILMMEPSGASEANAQIHLRMGSGDYFYAILDHNQLTIQSGIQKMSDENLNPIANESNDEIVAAIEDVPVRLTFDLGDLVLPFSEIKSLTQGYIVDLNTPVTQGVTIRSLNRIIGTGELVDIDGHMGVRIVKLLSQKPVDESAKEKTEDSNG